MKDEDATWTAFETFWDVYPRRQSRKDAMKAWRQLNPSPVLVEQMIRAVLQQTREHEWTPARRRFIPLPATWLRGARWEDESSLPPTGGRSWRDVCQHEPTCHSLEHHHGKVWMDQQKSSA